jgi:hypothetical protein
MSASIYFYPDPAGGVKQIDFNENATDLQEFPYRIRNTNVTMLGTPHHQNLGGRMRVRIILENFPTSANLDQQLLSLGSHIQRGGTFAFSADHTKTWAGYGSTAKNSGSTVFPTFGNAFNGYSGSAALAANDPVVIESENPEFNQEFRTVSSVTGGTITVSNACYYPYIEYGWMLRYRNFFPALYIPQDVQDQYNGQPFLTYYYRLTATLELQAEVDMAILSVGGTSKYGLKSSPSVRGASNFQLGTIDDLLGHAHTYDSTNGAGTSPNSWVYR